jgi:hypothetical protein
VNILVAGELLRHRVADAGKAPRRDYLRRTAKPINRTTSVQELHTKQIKKQERGPWCQASVPGAGAGTASTPCSSTTHTSPFRPPPPAVAAMATVLQLRPNQPSIYSSERCTRPTRALAWYLWADHAMHGSARGRNPV